MKKSIGITLSPKRNNVPAGKTAAPLAAAERALGYKFRDRELLRRALTHSSASHTQNNEQLEFLGDSVIQLAVTAWLYEQGGDEGCMTGRRQKLVSHSPLKCASKALGLPQYIVKGVPDIGEKALSSVYEAVCGAIFCDGGYAAAEKFVHRTLLAAHISAPRNCKGELQEYVQGKGMPLPEYRTRRDGGTENRPEFTCSLLVCGKTFRGDGGSKAEAERNAAEAALSHLKN